MKIKNIKLKVETDEQNQYVLQKHLDLNKGCKWFVYLTNGDVYWLDQVGTTRAVCSRWKGFRHLVINDYGDLILCLYDEYYNRRDEKEIPFDEFKELVGDKPELTNTDSEFSFEFDYFQTTGNSNEQTIQISDDCEIEKVEGNTIHIKKKEPKKTLWDKVCHYDESDKLLSVNNVQEALKEFISWVKKTPLDYADEDLIDTKAKEIFGTRLIDDE